MYVLTIRTYTITRKGQWFGLLEFDSDSPLRLRGSLCPGACGTCVALSGCETLPFRVRAGETGGSLPPGHASAVSVTLNPFALSDETSPVFSTAFM